MDAANSGIGSQEKMSKVLYKKDKIQYIAQLAEQFNKEEISIFNLSENFNKKSSTTGKAGGLRF